MKGERHKPLVCSYSRFVKTAFIKFHIIWPSGFRGKAVLEIDQ
jgi:hypothetical protein